jgi:hypothetical protein
MSLAVFKARKLHFLSLPKPTPQAAPGKPLIFHGFAPERRKATTGWRRRTSLPEN